MITQVEDIESRTYCSKLDIFKNFFDRALSEKKLIKKITALAVLTCLYIPAVQFSSLLLTGKPDALDMTSPVLSFLIKPVCGYFFMGIVYVIGSIAMGVLPRRG